VPEQRSGSRSLFRIFATLLGAALLAHLVLRTGPQTIWEHVRTVGWGIALIIGLAGISHVLKTWAWRLTFTCNISGLSWSRSIAMRLISEAIAQIGIVGRVLGEGVRVSLLGSAVPLGKGISSGALDAGIYTLTSAIVSVAGIMAAFLLAPIPGKWRLYAWLFSGILLAVVIVTGVAIVKGWKFIGGSARLIGQLLRCEKWISSKQAVIDSAENSLLSFHREAPAKFWGTVTLNFACHALAVLEVYIILHFMGVRIALAGAFVLEGLTKLINLAGTLNPGNIGTYEGGNILVTKLFNITAGAGLTLAFCRRARAIFWAAAGAVCLIVMKRTTDQPKTDVNETGRNATEELMNPGQQQHCKTVVILGDSERYPGAFSSLLARVGTLPVLLRTILTVQAQGATRIIVCVPEGSVAPIKSGLLQTGRLPGIVEWREVGPDVNLCSLVGDLAANSDRVMLLLGNRTYQPRLLQSAIEWNGHGALALQTNGRLAGVYVLSQAQAFALGNESRVPVPTLSALHEWMQCSGSLETQAVPGTSWHAVYAREDVPEAERKLDTWLVKPTDGLFAQTNRKISIPISRQLIKFPITPNMVSLFVLGVSFACGVFYARGGYWNMLIGAGLSLAASILDGCDGEVARLKLQSSKLGCWLETVCDYLYYLFVFGGIALGLTRSSGSTQYLLWGGCLFFGAITSFLVVGFLRQRMSGAEPEKFLAIWQKKADSRPSNLLLHVGRHTEFVIRRCFFPYALLFFAMVNVTNAVFFATTVIANLVWLIALYSVVAFSRNKRRSLTQAGSPAALSVTMD
jgi:phosphatidylglycerophosphate synthase